MDRNFNHWSPQGELWCLLYPVQHQYINTDNISFYKKTTILVLIWCITDLDPLILQSSVVIHAFVVVQYLSQHHWAVMFEVENDREMHTDKCRILRHGVLFCNTEGEWRNGFITFSTNLWIWYFLKQSLKLSSNLFKTWLKSNFYCVDCFYNRT